MVIKEINKYNINIEELKKEIKRMKNEENIVKINEIKEDNNLFYMIMDLYSFNLENYLKKRDKSLSINEIKEILLQLNKILKKLNEENIIYGNLKLSNILINLDEINKISIKLCYYDSIKFYEDKIFSNSYYSQKADVSEKELIIMEYDFFILLNFNLFIKEEIFNTFKNALEKMID